MYINSRYSLYLVTVFRVIVWTRVQKKFWILGLGANFPGKKGWWTLRLSHFSKFLLWKFQKFDLKKFDMYGYTLYLVTVFRVIVWTRVLKNILNFGSWGKFPGKKGSWTVRLSHFSKFFTDDMIWFWYDDMIWRYDMMMWYDDSVDPCSKNILNFGSWGKFPGKKGSWTVRLSHFSKFFTDDMIWCDVIWWLQTCDMMIDMIVLTRVVKIFWILGKFPGKKGSWTVRLSYFSKFFTDLNDDGYDLYLVIVFMVIVWTRVQKKFWILGLGANFQGKRVDEHWDLVIFPPSLI